MGGVINKLAKAAAPATRNRLAAPYSHPGAHTPETIASGVSEIDRILGDPEALARAALPGLARPGEVATPEQIEETRRLLMGWRRVMGGWQTR